MPNADSVALKSVCTSYHMDLSEDSVALKRSDWGRVGRSGATLFALGI